MHARCTRTRGGRRTPEEVAVVRDHPAGALEGLVRPETLERALDAHEQLLVEVWDGLVEDHQGLVDRFREEVESWDKSTRADERPGSSGIDGH